MKKTIAVLCSVLALAACNPFKITDPADPRFDPDSFSAQNYNDAASLQEALMATFPLDSPQTHVDAILIRQNGMTAINEEREDGYAVYYYYAQRDLPSLLEEAILGSEMQQIRIVYTENAKIREIDSQIVSAKTPPKFFINQSDKQEVHAVKLDNYKSAIELNRDLNDLFPPGSGRSFVERSLVTKAGATSRKLEEGSYVYSYMLDEAFWVCTHPPQWRIKTFYDERDKLSMMRVLGPCIK